MHSFEHDTDASRTVFGTGTVSRVARRADAGWAAGAPWCCRPRASGVSPSRWPACSATPPRASSTAPPPHTPVEVTEVALARAREVAADSVVSVGGGSTTGLGKALAARTGMPHLVVPTTYAGSEVTSLLGETADGEKVTRTGPEILPQVVVYDVALTTTLPWAVTVTSAVNAMAHAVEALYAADRTAETDAMAVDGLGALARRAAVAPARRPTTSTPAPTCSTGRGSRAAASRPSAWGCTTSSATPSAAASASRTPPPTPWCFPTRWPTTPRRRPTP